MNIVPHIPPALAQAQIAASDPAGSAWVSANAGSGKTYVLAQRVIRLLLDGVPPGKILCLTFTKAAAANMANQVFARLARWTALDNTALDAAIASIEGRPPDARRRLRARRLFAEALETPGGLKVQTIHAFCTSLLHQFPFEADVAARFEVLEERAESEMIDRLRITVLLEAAAARESPLGRALATAIVAAADTTFAEVVRDAIAKRAELEAWITRAGSVEAAIAELSRTLGVAPEDTLEQVDAEFLVSPFLPASEWPAISAALAQGSKTDREHVERLATAGAGNSWSNIEAYLRIFCTADLSPRANVATAVIRDQHPKLFERLTREQDRVCALLARRNALVTRERTAALVTIAQEVLRRYRAEKQRRGLLDYDDLIEKTLALFNNSAAAWVHYKLDLGIDHVLVDEAQDTSPQQWEVVRLLTAEFFAGAGARDLVRRSIFAVGDEKQSIYSFQGAAPHRFDEMRAHFQRAHDAGGMRFETLKFQYSFRSAPDVLGAVDTVFGRPQAYTGLTADPVATVHEAVRLNAPGFVEIWPLLKPDKQVEIEAWDAPFDKVSEQSPQMLLARRIAAAVRDWIARGEVVGDGEHRRRVTPGDVLVLVRQRGGLFEAIIRCLKDAGVEVAGADRLVLTDHIAVMDLMSLADALLLPEDDLALAEVLKSPLFGLDDDDLFALAYRRKGTLRAALREHAAEREIFAAASAMLDRLALDARRQTPFAFYARLLGADGGRKKMLARLGFEAADALDEFLALALEYENRHTPSLQGFVAWLRASQAQVKRDMDIVRDEVRVMTVHGAKGLEAPIVILADTVTRPTGPRDPYLLQMHIGGLREDAAPAMVWAGVRARDVAPVAEARREALRALEEEHRRLLYVGMTRAADRLIVCGAHGVRGKPQGCWYDLVYDALVADASELPADDGDGSVWRWCKSQMEAPAGAQAGAAQQRSFELFPPWLASPVVPEVTEALVISPSAVFDDGRMAPAVRPDRTRDAASARLARARGTVVHRLLQSLPGVPGERQEEVADRYLGRAAAGMDREAVETMLREVLKILTHPTFAPLFAAGTRAEVPIVGVVDTASGPRKVSGQIDRLAVTPEFILIADFKTDRSPPQAIEDVPRAYRTQLALYRLLVGRLYPGREVRAALVFSESANLMELPASILDAALAELGVRAA